MKVRLALILAALAAALVVAGCGGGAGSSSDPASLAPPDSPVFVEVTRPEGEAARNVESLAKRIAGVEDLGGLILSEIESSSEESGNEFDYAKEVQPWLGERAGIFLQKYDGSDFSQIGLGVETTDSEAAKEFIEKKLEEGDEAPEDGSYEDVDYEVADEGRVYGVIGDFLAVAEDTPTFKKMVDASDGESLADQDSYATAIAEAPSDSVALVFADIGNLVEQDGEAIDAETKAGLKILGIEPKNATAVASLIPGSDSIELDLGTDVLVESPPSGDASALLGTMPADSVAALASPEAGKAFGQLVDRIDREGLPSEGVKPHELKAVLASTGLQLDSIGKSIGDLAIFLEGSSESDLGGSVVLEATDATQAKNTIANIGLYLRAAEVPGVTALAGKLSGFSIRSPDLGSKPLVIATNGKRLAVAYGLPAATKAFAEAGGTLADDPVYKEAVASLGGTPISGFAAGPAALRLASGLISTKDREGFEEARPYLSKITYLALGSESSDKVGKAKLIVGVGE
jgi:hypothetical protein